MANDQDLEQQNRELKRRLEEHLNRFHAFLRLSHQAYGCVEFDIPIPTQLSASSQAASMLAARLVECNDEFAKIFGASRASDLIGAPFVSLILATDKFIVRAKRFVTSGYRLENEEIEREGPDAVKRYLVANVFGEIENACLTRMWLTMEDVTLRRLIDQAVDGSKTDYSQLAEQTDSAFWVLDWKNFKVSYVGSAYEQIWQISKQDLMEDPMCWLEAIHPDDRQRVSHAFLAHAAKGSYDQIYRLMLPDGGMRLIRDRGFPVPNRRGEIELVVGLATDITEPTENRVGLQHFFESSHQMLAVLDSRGEFLQVNPAFCRQTGYAESNLVGKLASELIDPNDQSMFRETVAQLNQGVAGASVVNRFGCQDGSWQMLEWNLAPAIETGTIYASIDARPNNDRSESAESIRTLLETLTPRELEIMNLVVEGQKNRTIAEELNISQRTVEKHRERVMKKLEVDNVPDLVRIALLVHNGH